MKRLFAIVPLVLAPTAAQATWSIVAADLETQEVAVGSATCVTGLDLRAVLPVVVVGEGGGAAQSAVDSSGERRQIIWDGLVAGQTADEIVAELVTLPGTAQHQHGVAETDGSSATQTGASTGAHASGVAGDFGTLLYAIQGNLLTGSPVVSQAVIALVSSSGDLPERLMAAMEAAALMGGDGRCSCSPGDPTGCGSPPPDFEKSAHIGFMIVARYGDTDDPSCTPGGCADGSYFMNFNVPFQSSGAPDPVVQLREDFDAWRATTIGVPDAVASVVSFTPVEADFVLRLEVFDWQGTPVTTGIETVTIEHAQDSAGGTDVGPIDDLGEGVYEVLLTRNDQPSGTDVFVVTIDDGVRPVVVPPRRASVALALLVDGFESGDTSAWSSVVPPPPSTPDRTF